MRRRQADLDLRAVIHHARDRNAAAVRLDNRFGNCHPKAGPARFSMRHERLENLRQELGWNADAGVSDINEDVRSAAHCADSHDSAVRHRLTGVLYQITQQTENPRDI